MCVCVCSFVCACVCVYVCLCVHVFVFLCVWRGGEEATDYGGNIIHNTICLFFIKTFSGNP